MVAEHASPRKPRAKRKASTPERELPDSAVLVVLESAEPPSSASLRIDASARRQMIEAAAYFLAERRGFAAGHEFEDWLAAERAVDARLSPSRAA